MEIGGKTRRAKRDSLPEFAVQLVQKSLMLDVQLETERAHHAEVWGAIGEQFLKKYLKDARV